MKAQIGTQAANADLLSQIFRNLEAAEQGTASTVTKALLMQSQAEEQRQIERQRADSLRAQAAQLIADSLAIEDEAEQSYRTAMREVQDVLSQLSSESESSAHQIKKMTTSVRAIPINRSKANLQAVSQKAS